MAFAPADEDRAKIGDALGLDPAEDAVELGLSDPHEG
jgi:hypothetical protein